MKQINNIIAGALTLLCGASMIATITATTIQQQTAATFIMCTSAILAIAILKTNE